MMNDNKIKHRCGNIEYVFLGEIQYINEYSKKIDVIGTLFVHECLGRGAEAKTSSSVRQ